MKTADDFSKEQQQMPDSELIKLVKEQISNLAKTGGRSHTMCVPPSIKDTDMLLSELVRRFEYASQDKWISVEDRLPEIPLDKTCGDFVLVFDWSNQSVETAFLSNVTGWQTEGGQNMIVTHWMPLLSPPKTK